MTDQTERRQQPDRRAIDHETAEFRSSVNGRLEAVAEELHKGESRFQSVEDRMDRLEAKLDNNTTITARLEKATKDIVEFIETLTVLLKFGDWLSRVAVKIWKPASYIAATIAAVIAAWASFKGGK
jgi:chromosome segregation ATPase